jgi:RNA polymerase sigma-70 factor, ECF subfamily
MVEIASGAAPARTVALEADAQLVLRIVAGDRDAFRQLMQQHNGKLFRTARAIVRDEQEAEDVVQEAYLRAFRMMAGFRGEATLSTWLVRIVVNEAIGRLRRAARQGAGCTLDEAPRAALQSTAATPEGLAMRAEAGGILERSIDALPDAVRVAFVMHAIDGMSIGEISAGLGIPPSTVRDRVRRARGSLQRALGRDADWRNAFWFAGERCARVTSRVLART